MRFVGVAALALAVVTLADGLMADALEAGNSPFLVDAGGRAPVASERWEIRDEDSAIGIITSVARCGDIVYLSDFQLKIRRLDLRARRSLPAITTEGPPGALAADCQDGVLYVVQRQAASWVVHAIDLRSGSVLARLPLPANFHATYNAALGDAKTLYVSGLVLPPGTGRRFFDTALPATFHHSLRLGLKVSLGTGATEPLLAPYEDDCAGASACMDVQVAPRGDGWIAAQGASTRIGIYDRADMKPRLLDITSPRFARTGRTIPPGASADAMMRWRGENSTLAGTFPFKDDVATVHWRPQIGPNWALGQWTRFIAFMNIHRTDGTGLVSDIGLPDLPVGRDHEALFVVDYGPSGRQGTSPAVTLVRIPVGAQTAVRRRAHRSGASRSRHERSDTGETPLHAALS